MALWLAVNTMRVAERYETTPDGCIVECGDLTRAALYDPWQFPELVGGLVAIRQGDATTAMDFAQKWGLTGVGLDGDRFHVKERIDWLEGHASIMRLALTIIDLLRENETNELDRILAGDWLEENAQMSSVLLYGQKIALHNASNASGRLRASLTLEALVTPRTDRVRLKYRATNSGGLSRVLVADALLEVIYCHLGSACEGKLGYYECAYRKCFKRWPIGPESRGPKPKYCPPEPGSSDSLCSRRERYYRGLDRHNEEDSNAQAQA